MAPRGFTKEYEDATYVMWSGDSGEPERVIAEERFEDFWVVDVEWTQLDGETWWDDIPTKAEAVRRAHQVMEELSGSADPEFDFTGGSP